MQSVADSSGQRVTLASHQALQRFYEKNINMDRPPTVASTREQLSDFGEQQWSA